MLKRQFQLKIQFTSTATRFVRLLYHSASWRAFISTEPPSYWVKVHNRCEHVKHSKRTILHLIVSRSFSSTGMRWFCSVGVCRTAKVSSSVTIIVFAPIHKQNTFSNFSGSCSISNSHKEF